MGQKGIAPAWTRLRRKPCEACGAKFKPVRPNQRFCQNKCRNDFHHHGGAYVALKPFMEKRVDAQVKALARELKARIEKLEAALQGRAA